MGAQAMRLRVENGLLLDAEPSAGQEGWGTCAFHLCPTLLERNCDMMSLRSRRMNGHRGPTSRGESQHVYPEKETPGSEEGRDAPYRQGSASVEGTDQRANRQTSSCPGKGVTPTLTDPSPRHRKYSGSEFTHRTLTLKT